MERYYEKRDARSGSIERKCQRCSKKLSRYNENAHCGACSSLKKPEKDKLRRVLGL
jgi:ribosomal protein S27AE